MLSTWKIAPALAAGCTIVHKPAEFSPLSAAILAEVSEQAGLPAGVWNMVNGFGETVGKQLTEHPAIKAVAFIGESQAGSHIFENIREEWIRDTPVKQQMLEHFSKLLIMQIARVGGQDVSTTVDNSNDLRLYRRYSDLVEQHYADHWQLSDYTDKVGVSQSRLNQVCQKVANNPPKKLIHDRLLRETKRLLIFSNLSSNQISYRLGFKEPAYFSRFFKQNTGMTPQSYRRANG